VPGGLTEQILEQHQASRASARGETSRRLAADHVLLDGLAGRIAIGAFASLGLPVRRAVGLACLDEPFGIGSASLPDLGAIAEAARRAGCHLAPAGRGECDLLYRERFAAPGKLAFAAGDGAPSAGALGTLVLGVDALEAAAALAGAPLFVADPEWFAVRVEGGLLPGVTGTDVALAIAARLPADACAPIVEITGRGVANLAMADRLAIASQASLLGASAVLFPADERTRQALAAERREADWKPFEAAASASLDPVMTLDLETIEPLMAPDEDRMGARPVRHAMGMPVSRVVVGSYATLADLARLASLVGERRVHHATELVWVPGSPRLLQSAEASGVSAALERAGARLSAGSLPSDVGLVSSPIGTGLFTASRGEHRAGRRTAWSAASLETCAAAALAGCLVDPRELDRTTSAAFESRALEAARLLEPESASSASIGDGAGSRGWTGKALDRPLRGAVLLECGDRVGADRILPLGARQEKRLQDLVALSEFAFAPLDAEFAGHARRQGGGFVTAGRDFGTGEPGELAAVVLAALGVRAVIARSYAPGFVRRLTHAGVLAAEFRHERDEREIGRGDELEIPGLPGALEPGKPLTVRNLTRGSQYTVAHRLDVRGIDWLRAGGLLAAARADEARD
jgi:aconitate hydratase